MELYFDNAATTKTSDKAIEKIIEMSKVNYGNPSSVHKLGLLAEREITKSRVKIANILNAKEDEIFFTSGATEANNLAIIGSALANIKRGKNIITQKSEHASVLESMKYLETLGFQITYLENDKYGQIDYEKLSSSITDETILVSLMHINNETGAMLDIEKIGNLIKSKNKNTLFHTDIVQSFCKFTVDVVKYNIDLCSISGHKLNAPKGIGCLFIKKGVKIQSRQLGGSQEKKIRPGTENILGITALSVSIDDIYNNKSENYDYICTLKDLLIKIQDEITDTIINSEITNISSSPYVVNISFLGCKGEVLVHALEENDIYLSTGSACHKGTDSQILINYGLDKEIASSAIRISFSKDNTISEVLQLKNALIDLVPTLRRYTKR